MRKAEIGPARHEWYRASSCRHRPADVGKSGGVAGRRALPFVDRPVRHESSGGGIKCPEAPVSLRSESGKTPSSDGYNRAGRSPTSTWQGSEEGHPGASGSPRESSAPAAIQACGAFPEHLAGFRRRSRLVPFKTWALFLGSDEQGPSIPRRNPTATPTSSHCETVVLAVHAAFCASPSH
jgi:hypothetical protein